ncbi:MAG: GTPase HflX [Microscillaceae bacterium]|nr:GTPase HflX [Microscillaceae bacterium]
MTKYHLTAKPAETAVLVAVIQDRQDPITAQAHLDELAFLAQTLALNVKQTFVQRLEKPDSKTFLGKGKLMELTEFVKEQEIDIVIFDDDLSPSQVRNLERAINGTVIDEAKTKILDRSLLILDIFSHRARTVQAKTQVELAQYQYLLPRLTRMWTHLSKQKGGIGMRGPGEKELETDRRIVKDKIALLRQKLDKIDQQSTTRRKARTQTVRVALVGYTNVGKSTLMQLLSKSEVFAENKLFATVDSTVRKVVLHQLPFLLTDTVGFIRKLPTLLIESFKSTLDEITEADLLIHVADIASPDCEEQVEVVNQTLAEIGAANKPTLLVFNKLDLLPAHERHIKASTREHEKTLGISAQKNLHLDELRQMLYEMVAERYQGLYPNQLIPDFDFSDEAL